MAVSHNAADSLNKFCRWHPKLSAVEHDYAILLTGLDICANGDAPCDTLGECRIEIDPDSYEYFKQLQSLFTLRHSLY